MSSSGIQRWAVVATVAAISGCAVAADEGSSGTPDVFVQTDTGSPAPDTDVADTGTKPDTSIADTGTKPDTSVSDTATAPDTSVSDTSNPDVNPDAKHDGEACADATKITLTAAGTALLAGETSRGYVENTAAGGTACRLGSGGDHVYELVVPAGKKATVKVTPTDGTFDPVVNLVAGPASACGVSGTCVVGGVDAANGALPETISWSNAATTDTTVFVVVDSLTSGATSQGVYDLDVKLADSTFGETCAEAKTIPVTGTTATVLSGETLTGYVNDYGSGTNCSGASGPDHLYKVDVPPSQRLTATVKPLAVPAAWDVSLNMQTIASCGVSPRVCISGVDAGLTGISESLTFSNGTAATQSIYVVVESWSTTKFGDYDLTLQLAPIPTNDTCANPTVIAVPPGSVTGDTSAATSDYTGGTNCAGTAGKDLVYAVDVPAGKQLAATILGSTSGFAPTLDVVDASACAATTTRVCLASVSTTAAAPAGTARWTNAGTTPKTVHLVVDSTSATSAGAFSLSVAFADPPAGDTCANPLPLVADGTTVTSGTTADVTNDFGSGSGCGQAAGPDKVYSVTIPPGQVLATMVLGTGGFVPSISYQSAAQCSTTPRVCSGGVSTSSTSPTAVLRYANESTTASETINLVVDSAATVGGTYSLTGSLTTTKAGDICGKAEPIATGSNISGLTTTGYSNEYDGGTGCKPASGADRVFSVTVPNGKQLTALVTPAATFDPTLSLIAGPESRCAAHVCNASVDAKTAGQPETATYSNKTGADQTVFIVVDSNSSTTPAGDFSLLTALTDAPTGGTGTTGGETCDTAPLLATSATPLVINGDMLGYANDYETLSSSTCWYDAGPDAAYQVSIPNGATLNVTLASSSGEYFDLDLVLGASSSCGATLPCQARKYTSSSTTLTYTNSSGSDQTGFLIVDLDILSTTVSVATPYSLTVTVN
jgi:hypothetical protein